MKKAIFNITKMDCPSEEQMIRIKLDNFNHIDKLLFDIPNRTVTIYYSGNTEELCSLIDDLKLGSKLVFNDNVEESIDLPNNAKKERNVLWAVLIINFSFFVIEMLYGLLSNSMGLIADSLDMLADSLVYILSLVAVGNTLIRKKKVAKISGYFQILLAFIGLVEVFRRFFSSAYVPIFQNMIIISILALIANYISLYLIQKARSDEAHMQASLIFTSNDIIINIGVIVAGGLVYFFKSNIPDLVIGLVVFLIVLSGALRILKLAK